METGAELKPWCLEFRLWPAVSLLPLVLFAAGRVQPFEDSSLPEQGRANTRDSIFRSEDKPSSWIWEVKGEMLDNNLTVGCGTYRVARRFRSDIGESIPPTPSAAFPRRGKKPCKPRIAVA